MSKSFVKKIIVTIVILIAVVVASFLMLRQVSKKVEIWPYGGECCPSGKSPKGGYHFGVYSGPQQKCCTGKTIFPDYRNRECPMQPDQSLICSDCGNKTCERWEDNCNCPEDCKE